MKIAKNEIFIVSLIALAFLFIRLPGINKIYHQDENKYAMSVSRADNNTPHPPLSKAIMVQTANLFGRNHFRVTPLLFSLANLLLLYYFTRIKFGKKIALWSILLFTVVFYSVLGSLMVDIDGAILPFFFLLTLISHFKWETTQGKRWIVWSGILSLSLILGFLTKLSFVIVIVALVLDFFVTQSKKVNRRTLLKYSLGTGALFIILVISLFVIKFFLPFNLTRTISHATDYFKLSGRAYIQILIQTVKGLMYSSPLLLAPLVFLKKEDLYKIRLFLIFIAVGLLFYLVIFDFSRAALDKYLVFATIPLSIMAAIGLNNVWKESSVYTRKQKILFITGLSALLTLVFALQFMPHFVPALYPKEAWIGRIISLRWNFVFPFTGGSGPIGFYVSWLFIALGWILSLAAAITVFFYKNLRKPLAVAILLFGILYNVVFVEEYLLGRINGNSDRLFRDSLAFIANNPDIKKVITYNDIGGGEIGKFGKYERRLYAAPKYEQSYKGVLDGFKGHYLVVDIPHLSPDSPYAKYFATCPIVYKKYSGKISSTIYACGLN